MGSAGDELKRQQAQLKQVLKTEEEQLPVRWSVVWRCWMKNSLGKGDTLDGETALPPVRQLRLPC